MAAPTRMTRGKVPVENTYFEDNTANVAPAYSYPPQYPSATVSNPQLTGMNMNGMQVNPQQFNYGAQMPPGQGGYNIFDPTANMNNMLNSPVTSLAVNYGRSFAEQHATAVQQNIEKYVGISRLKYYFFVDTNYVVSKIRLLLFPFIHRDWQTRFNSQNPIEPRLDVNAPDLYVPLMSYVTYLILVGIRLGMRNEFAPEKLGALGSSSLALLVFEVLICTVVQYVTSVQSDLRVFDLLAFSGYKFVPVCILLLFALTAGDSAGIGYTIILVYACASLIYFLTRTLKYQLLRHVADDGRYGAAGAGHKRRGLFIVLFAIFQALFIVYFAR